MVSLENPSTLLDPANAYYVSGPTTYGALTAVNDGTVYFNAVPIGTTCSPQGIQGNGTHHHGK